MDREARVRRRIAWLAAVVVALGGAACGGNEDQPPPDTASAAVTPSSTPAPSLTPSPPEPSPGEAPPDVPAPASETPLATERAALGLLVAVDKQRSLPAGYQPADLTAVDAGLAAPGFGGLLLRVEASQALEEMLASAVLAGHDIRVRSAYRSYAEQERTFAYWVSVLGEAEARRVSAEAGHSEHQLGTTVDLTDAGVGYDLTEAFGASVAGGWLAENAHVYGFALSYPAGGESVTGYAYEPWHFRYIGADHAAAWRTSGLTLIEYLRGLEG